MKPAPLNLPTIWRGCDWGPVTMKWKDKNGEPINLSGWQPKAQSLNIDLKPVITDTEQGITVMSLSRIDTAELRLGEEKWDWIWERIGDPAPYRFPPFLSGKVPIREPLTSVNGQHPITPPPENDDWENAIELLGESGSVEGTTVNATREANEPAGDNSVWYKWTAPRTRNVTFRIGMDFLNIQSGVQVNEVPNNFHNLYLVAYSTGNPAAVHWAAIQGTLYYLRLFKRTRTSGFTLSWEMSDPAQ